jgi:hypothetical protein
VALSSHANAVSQSDAGAVHSILQLSSNPTPSVMVSMCTTSSAPIRVHSPPSHIAKCGVRSALSMVARTYSFYCLPLSPTHCHPINLPHADLPFTSLHATALNMYRVCTSHARLDQPAVNAALLLHAASVVPSPVHPPRCGRAALTPSHLHSFVWPAARVVTSRTWGSPAECSMQG